MNQYRKDREFQGVLEQFDLQPPKKQQQEEAEPSPRQKIKITVNNPALSLPLGNKPHSKTKKKKEGKKAVRESLESNPQPAVQLNPIQAYLLRRKSSVDDLDFSKLVSDPMKLRENAHDFFLSFLAEENKREDKRRELVLSVQDATERKRLEKILERERSLSRSKLLQLNSRLEYLVQHMLRSTNTSTSSFEQT